MSSNCTKKTPPDNGFRRIGSIAKPHGLHGDFFLHLESDLTQWLTTRNEVWTSRNDQWASHEVVHWRHLKDRLVLKLRSIPDRTAVEAAAATVLYVPEDDVRLALENTSSSEEDDFFLNSDLVGLKVIHQGLESRTAGVVSSVHEFPACNQLEIDKQGGGSFLLPFVKALIVEVDIGGGIIKAIIPEGLEDLE
jgi:16S rRNA processing protein RimM